MNLSLKEKEARHAQRKRIYPVRNRNSLLGKQKISNGVYLNRTFSSNFHHYVIDGDIAARPPTGPKSGQGGWLPGEPQTVGNNADTVPGG
jgi:hypothetical protein